MNALMMVLSVWAIAASFVILLVYGASIRSNPPGLRKANDGLTGPCPVDHMGIV